MNENFDNNVSNNTYQNNINPDINILQNNVNMSTNNQKMNSDKITLYDLNCPKPIENMPYIYCPNCNNKVIADSRFCSFCGTKISRK